MAATQRSGLTRRGWSLLGAAVGLLIGGRILGAVELSMLAVAAAVLLALSYGWTALRSPRWVARRTIQPRRPTVGGTARVEVEITNADARDHPPATVVDVLGDLGRSARFSLPALRGGTSTNLAYRIPTPRRGRLSVGPLLFVRQDPFGLVRQQSIVTAPEEIVIRPRIHAITAPPLGPGPSSGLDCDAHAPAEDGDEFRALRPYATGDDLRRVHWRTSARLDELVVREHEARRRDRVVVCLDVAPQRHDVTSFELALEVVASVVARSARSRREVAVSLSTGTVLEGRIDLVLDHLAVIQPQGPDRFAAMLRTGRGDAVTVVVAPRLDPAIAARTVALGTRGRVVVVTTGDHPTPLPRRIQAVDASVGPFSASWNRAIARWPITDSSRSPARS